MKDEHAILIAAAILLAAHTESYTTKDGVTCKHLENDGDVMGSCIADAQLLWEHINGRFRQT